MRCCVPLFTAQKSAPNRYSMPCNSTSYRRDQTTAPCSQPFLSVLLHFFLRTHHMNFLVSLGS